MLEGSNRKLERRFVNGKNVLRKTCKTQFSRERFENVLQADVLMRKANFFSPRIVSFGWNDGQSWLEEEFIDGNTLIQEPLCLEEIDQLIQITSELHQISAPFFCEDLIGKKDPMNSFETLCLRRMETISSEIDPDSFHKYNAFSVRIQELLKSVDWKLIQPSFVHFDLRSENIMRSDQKLLLVDFESARFYDPVWDFVGLLSIFQVAGFPIDQLMNFGHRKHLQFKERLSIALAFQIMRGLCKDWSF